MDQCPLCGLQLQHLKRGAKVRYGPATAYQFYSKPFAGGLFFEIVQRIDGYDGYGAPNAPFRIAAQKRLMRPKGMPRK